MTKYIGFVYMVLSAFCFSLMGILSKLIFEFGISTMDLIMLQNIINTIILLIYFAIKNFKELYLPKKDILTIFVQGIFGSVPVLIFYYLTLQRISASVACMLLFTNPIFVTIYFIVFEGRKNNIIKTAAVLLTLIGSVFVLNITPSNLSNIDILGIGFGFISSISYAFYNVYAEKKLSSFEPPVILFYCCIVVIVFMSIINPGFFTFSFLKNPKLLLYVVVLAITTGILPVVFLYKGIRHLGAEIAAIVATAEIPITLVLSVIVLKEKIVLLQILGSTMILTSILLLRKAD